MNQVLLIKYLICNGATNFSVVRLLFRVSRAQATVDFNDLPFKSSSPHQKAITDGRLDGQTDKQTDGHPNSIGPRFLCWGLIILVFALVW